MKNIDFIKLIKQEPEFAEYAKEVTFTSMIVTNKEFIKGLYSFYESGLSIEQAANLLLSAMRLKDEG